MRVLVTGADGFVGSWLIPRLLEEGHDVVAAVQPDRPLFTEGAPPPWGIDVPTVPLQLNDDVSVRAAVSDRYDALVHLAAVSSGSDARRDPGQAWEINAAGTARLAGELGRQRLRGVSDPVFLLTSTSEVYGAGPERPRVEEDPAEPRSPYAASKLAAEVAALEAHRRTGLRVVVTRAFAHTGRGQDDRFVVPAFVRRLLAAKRSGAKAVKVGNLDPVREFLHVSDVVSAYVELLSKSATGEVYNVASGTPVSLGELFRRLAQLVGHDAEPEPDPELVRPADIPHLVGDSTKLRKLTGWQPRVSLEKTLAEVVDAQAN